MGIADHIVVSLFNIMVISKHFYFRHIYFPSTGFPGRACGKEPTCQWEIYKRRGFSHWAGKSSEGGNGNHSSILAWACWAIVHRVTQTRT